MKQLGKDLTFHVGLNHPPSHSIHWWLQNTHTQNNTYAHTHTHTHTQIPHVNHRKFKKTKSNFERQIANLLILSIATKLVKGDFS